ncbi:oxidoreductase [Nocardia salmonicida]|uniref:oxidoreductase n=1 Tax=Nocardia salmonicida TaxID=53431 RepID=UPI00340DAA7A
MTKTPQVALVTGSTSGIGKATAIALAAAGFQVIGTGRSTAGLTAPAGVTYLDLDVTSDESVVSAVSQVMDLFGRIDVLVNNAGVGLGGAAEESSVGLAQDVFDVNVFGVLRMTNAVLPLMRAQGKGRIVNVSSILGMIPAPYMAIYAATKHAVEGYSESIDHELREHGVRVVLVEPGYTGTAFEASTLSPDAALPAYADQRDVAREVVSAAMQEADDPAVVARVIVTAATSTSPRVRYQAGSMAGRVSILRRLVPARAFDRSIRKLNRLAG